MHASRCSTWLYLVGIVIASTTHHVVCSIRDDGLGQVRLVCPLMYHLRCGRQIPIDANSTAAACETLRRGMRHNTTPKLCLLQQQYKDDAIQMIQHVLFQVSVVRRFPCLPHHGPQALRSQPLIHRRRAIILNSSTPSVAPDPCCCCCLCASPGQPRS